MPPLVSVIIPAFNAEATLAETIDSVLAQSVEDWEAIVSDDGSDDRTREIAREYAERDSRVQLVENEPARHPGPTRNAAIALASGEYIAMLDADDIWQPDKLKIQLEAIGKVDRPGICFTLAEDFGEGEGPLPRGTQSTPMPPTRQQQYRLFLLTSNQACTSSWLLEREFAREIGPFSHHPLLAGYEDWDFALRALWLRPLVPVRRRLVRYRVHPASISSQRRGQWERAFEIYRQAEARGHIPANLRGKCQSVAWLIRAELALADDSEPWRRSFLKAWSYDRANPRRWPSLAALGMSRAMMRRFYGGLKRLGE